MEHAHQFVATFAKCWIAVHLRWELRSMLPRLNERIVFHTCKSRACSSCGNRATIQWQRERWAALPEVPYKGITFTMPDVLWPLFRDNRRLASVLPALAAIVIQTLAYAKYGLRIGVITILHTFNGLLNFNPHVHIMVTAGGLDASSSWVSSVFFDQDRLTALWRNAVINLLRSASRAGVLHAAMAEDEILTMLSLQEKRWWNVKIQSLESREHFFKYAGRYLRRPPIAQRRITSITDRSITFWSKNKKLGVRVEVQCSPEEFIDRWAQHIRDRYQHSVRYFGLLAPRTVSQTSAGIFAMLGQKQNPGPDLSWAFSIERTFGKNPLVDQTGERMQWVRRVAPQGQEGKYGD